MSSTITWQTAAAGDWNVGTNWSGGVVPLDTDNAALALSGSYDVTVASGETEGIVSLAITNAAATLLLGGLLNRGSTLSGAGPVVFTSIWVGHRRIDCARHPEPWLVQPVRIAPHAFGRDCPRRPLYLSPDHAVLVEDVLIPDKHLIVGEAVRQVRRRDITYYHVELPAHAVLLAEGLPAESYLDTGDRHCFANAGPVAALHPAWGSAARDIRAVFDAFGAAPLQVTGPVVERTRTRLAATRGSVRTQDTGRAGGPGRRQRAATLRRS